MRTSWYVLAVVCAFPSSARATTFFVAPSGDDGAPGTKHQPLKTIQRAADLMQAGDSTVVEAGQFAGFNVEDKLGRSGAPLTFIARPGARITTPGPVPVHQPLNPTLRAPLWPDWPNGINVLRSQHVVIVGFEVANMPRQVTDASGRVLHRGGAGIRLEDCRFVVVANNQVHDNGRWGIFSTFCDDVTVLHNEAARSFREHGIYLSNSGDRYQIIGNRVFDNAASGIQINADNTFDSPEYRRFAFPDGISSDSLIEGNEVWGNGARGGAALNLDGLSDSVIRFNHLHDNHATGIALYQSDAATASQRNLVEGNRIEMPADGRSGIRVVGCPAEEVQDGLCASANTPLLPEWQRPPAFATGATGNVIRGNVILTASATRGTIDIDSRSLAPDPSSGQHFFSDFNRLTDQFEIDARLVQVAEWRALTGQDRRSLVMP
jgi:parallel beta-helix repeat protein